MAHWSVASASTEAASHLVSFPYHASLRPLGWGHNLEKIQPFQLKVSQNSTVAGQDYKETTKWRHWSRETLKMWKCSHTNWKISCPMWALRRAEDQRDLPKPVGARWCLDKVCTLQVEGFSTYAKSFALQSVLHFHYVSLCPPHWDLQMSDTHGSSWKR